MYTIAMVGLFVAKLWLMSKQIKFIQVNIYKGKYLDALIKFLNEQKPDFVSMQEVASGDIGYFGDKNTNIYEILQRSTGYFGYFESDQKFSDSPNSVTGNAVLSRYPIESTNYLEVSKFRPMTVAEFSDPVFFSRDSHTLVDATVNFEGTKIHILSSHGAWTAPPTDTEETIGGATKMANYLKSLNEPFIFGIDFNAVIQSKTVGIVNRVAKNLLLESGILQTTHPKIHKIAPRGFLIDFIFTSSEFKLLNIEAPEIIVSDHLPVVAILEL